MSAFALDADLQARILAALHEAADQGLTFLGLANRFAGVPFATLGWELDGLVSRAKVAWEFRKMALGREDKFYMIPRT